MQDLLTIAQAREKYGINKYRMTKLIQTGAIPVYTNPLDNRSQLVKPSDVEKALHPDTPSAPLTRKRVTG